MSSEHLCVICTAPLTRFVEYDAHLKETNLWKRCKNVVKRSRSLFSSFFFLLDTLTPTSFPALKRITRWLNSPFAGRIGICTVCGHGSLLSPPTLKQLTRYYRGQYWTHHGIPQKKLDPKDYLQNDRAFAQAIFVYDTLASADAHSVLEIGAAGAHALLYLRDFAARDKKKMQFKVCEPGDEWSSYYALCRIDRVARMFPFPTTEHFDYIHSSHWLEHVINLPETVARIADLLPAGGHTFVEVPNTEHQYWNRNQSDMHHIHFFTEDSLRRIFEAHGFRLVKSAHCGLTYDELRSGVRVTPEHIREHKNGVWLRALFEKK